ncbi:olfactory receptor 14A16-like [Melozone crissalis]|uniref:olfactory receptor 14A16-like n=1 Tax=Melozone crissalis TaxID=40204 RepID=UPI0023DAD1E5|nr:olfactory receptor 14A16-like [Melozone crissalis]
MSNSSSVRHFLLLALADTRQLQLLHFCLLLGISLAALLGNGLIISAVACGHHLHTPMFFFLLNLALSDLGMICTTVPKAMHNSLWDTRNISYNGCAAQVFLIFFFITAQLSLLTIMFYDRYVSICKPLHYGTLLGSRACAHMAAAAWTSVFLHALLHTSNTFSLPLCHGNALGQFFCEIPPFLKLSCSYSYLRELGLIAVSACLVFGCSVFMIFSYVQIFRAVLRIPSEQGWHKAFSTCLPHLAVVSLFLSTSFFTYLKPLSISSPSLDLALSFLYSVAPPALNPLIYSRSNQELKATQAGKPVKPRAGPSGEVEMGSPGEATAPAGRVLEAATALAGAEAAQVLEAATGAQQVGEPRGPVSPPSLSGAGVREADWEGACRTSSAGLSGAAPSHPPGGGRRTAPEKE